MKHGAVSSQASAPAITKARQHEFKISNLPWELATSLDVSSGLVSDEFASLTGSYEQARSYVDNGGVMESSTRDLDPQDRDAGGNLGDDPTRQMTRGGRR